MLDEIPCGLKLISVRETAKRLSIGRSTLYQYLNKKSPKFNSDLPQPVRVGSIVGFVEHELDRYIRGLMQARGGGVGL
jgi:prophage regulatory protein